MDRQMLDKLLPLGYAALLAASALFFDAALVAIAVIGALALAAYYAAIRPRLMTAEGAGRDRQRSRSRDRDA